MARETFAARLRRLRLERRWTQARLAEKAGLTQATISVLERGRRSRRATNAPRAWTLAALAEALGAPSLAIWDGVWF